MKKLLFFFLIFLCIAAQAQKVLSNLQYVDTRIGGVGLILEPTKPTVHLPNKLIRMFPIRKDQIDDQIEGYTLTISSHRQASLFSILPLSGIADDKVWNFKSTYNLETHKPESYYALLNDNVEARFAPSAHSGFWTFDFDNEKGNQIKLTILNDGKISADGKTLSGEEDFAGMKAFFYAELNADFKIEQNAKKYLLKLANGQKHVAFKYGLSFISVEQAKQNLQNEIPVWDFAAVKQNATKAWNKVLNQINVTGGTDAQKRVFYTSLYRSYERMVDINEFGKYYSAYDHAVHQSEKPFFVDNWLWDTYIALEPLQTILNPKQEGEKIDSYVKMYQQSGWMPSFALLYGDNPCMTGNHAAPWILDATMKGITNFDLKTAYQGLKKNSLEATLLPWENGPACSLDTFYTQHGYMPALKPEEKETVAKVHGFERRQAVSVTLENSYDDWCIAQLSKFSNNDADYPLFLKRSNNYKNVYRADKGFMWPKDADGNWIEPFDPKFSGGMGGRAYFTENNAYTYNWDVKHDFDGLFDLMGGKPAAEAKLDELFRADLGRSKYQLWGTFPDATGMVGQFVMGNEPSFHIPYLYNFLGAPYKTQSRIRMLMDTWYTDNLFGIPGDEDGGGMTAFVVFSMMGFFPVTPGVPVYNIGSPVFNTISIKLDNGKTFTINAKNNSDANKYIQSATLDGNVLDKAWFTHKDLLNGATINLNMGSRPNKNWGTSNLPISKINTQLTLK